MRTWCVYFLDFLLYDQLPDIIIDGLYPISCGSGDAQMLSLGRSN